MISKSTLIAYIAFDGSLVASGAFGGGSSGVFGVRNISGSKSGRGTGLYQLRVGPPALPATQVDNEWSRSLGNTRVVVELFAGSGFLIPPTSPFSYNLVQLDLNTYEINTYYNNVASDLMVQFSVESLQTF